MYVLNKLILIDEDYFYQNTIYFSNDLFIDDDSWKTYVTYFIQHYHQFGFKSLHERQINLVFRAVFVVFNVIQSSKLNFRLVTKFKIEIFNFTENNFLQFIFFIFIISLQLYWIHTMIHKYFTIF